MPTRKYRRRGFAHSGTNPLLLIFSLFALAFSAAGSARALSPRLSALELKFFHMTKKASTNVLAFLVAEKVRIPSKSPKSPPKTPYEPMSDRPYDFKRIDL